MFTFASRQLLDKAIESKHKQLVIALENVTSTAANLPPISQIIRDLQALHGLVPADEIGTGQGTTMLPELFRLRPALKALYEEAHRINTRHEPKAKA